ncbi:MAG: hypothetical protein KGH49_04300, partial [Candidatus Micrarchaeota archaeon]|nr:hypothetical protein [Candidatus Micrarchaeota archaeon]
VLDVSVDRFNEMIKGARPEAGRIIKFMCDEHGFSHERVGKVADKLLEIKGRKGQKGINTWL